jgi:hypothetical protein
MARGVVGEGPFTRLAAHDGSIRLGAGERVLVGIIGKHCRLARRDDLAGQMS